MSSSSFKSKLLIHKHGKVLSCVSNKHLKRISFLKSFRPKDSWLISFEMQTTRIKILTSKAYNTSRGYQNTEIIWSKESGRQRIVREDTVFLRPSLSPLATSEEKDPFFLLLILSLTEGHEKHASREIDFQARNCQSLVTSSPFICLYFLLLVHLANCCSTAIIILHSNYSFHDLPSLTLISLISLFSSVFRKIVTKGKKLQKNWVERKNH